MSWSSFAGGQLIVYKVLGDPSISHAVDISKPAKWVLCEQGKHARDPGTSKDLSVWDMVTPLDTPDASQTAHRERIKSFFFFGLE